MSKTIFVARYTRKEIQANRDKVYIFGDNLARRGLGGQAKECRGEPNAIGIPTKRSPYEFFSDGDFDEWLAAVSKDCCRILAAISEGKTIVWPQDGIGTGLADLKSCAPRIWAELQKMVTSLGGPAKR